jgi:hypothetical protein
LPHPASRGYVLGEAAASEWAQVHRLPARADTRFALDDGSLQLMRDSPHNAVVGVVVVRGDI